jgi:hypothetical protein
MRRKHGNLPSPALRAAVFAALCMLGSAMLPSSSWAQGKPTTDEQAQAKEWAERASRLALAEARAYEFHLREKDGPRLELSKQPILKWSNTYNMSVYGSVFVWTRSGRPEVIGSIFKFYSPRLGFQAEFHSLAAEPLTAVKNDEVVWQPSKAGVAFKPLADAPAPAKTATGRLVQMRDIARNFSADVTTVIAPKTKHHLRLLPQPLMRYGGSSEHLLDGALFAFARETDPDVVLLLEARGGEAPHWESALARMHVGALNAQYRDKVVWSVEELIHPYLRKNESYMHTQKLPEPKVD